MTVAKSSSGNNPAMKPSDIDELSAQLASALRISKKEAKSEEEVADGDESRRTAKAAKQPKVTFAEGNETKPNAPKSPKPILRRSQRLNDEDLAAAEAESEPEKSEKGKPGSVSAAVKIESGTGAEKSEKGKPGSVSAAVKMLAQGRAPAPTKPKAAAKTKAAAKSKAVAKSKAAAKRTPKPKAEAKEQKEKEEETGPEAASRKRKRALKAASSAAPAKADSKARSRKREPEKEDNSLDSEEPDSVDSDKTLVLGDVPAEASCFEYLACTVQSDNRMFQSVFQANLRPTLTNQRQKIYPTLSSPGFAGEEEEEAAGGRRGQEGGRHPTFSQNGNNCHSSSDHCPHSL